MTATTTVLGRPGAGSRRFAVDRIAVADALPMVAGLAPFALLIGVAVGSLAGNPAAGLSGSLLLYAGSAQLSAISLLDQGASALAAVATIALVNARFLVYSAALAPHFAGQPSWFRWTMPHFIVEPSYGLVSARDDLDDPARFRCYWMTINAVVATGWVATMTVGALVGPVVPDIAALAFLPTAAFLTMLGPALKDRPALAAGAVAAFVAVGVAGARAAPPPRRLAAGAVAAFVAVVVPVPGATRVLVGLVAGALAGVAAEGRSR